MEYILLFLVFFGVFALTCGLYLIIEKLDTMNRLLSSINANIIDVETAIEKNK